MGKFLALWAIALVLLASVLATPVPAVHDLHATSLDLFALEGDDAQSGLFAVRVERVDKVMDLDESQEKALAAHDQDVDGTLLAARVANIIVMFSVSPKGEVSVNGQPIPMGMSNVKVEADVQTGITADGEKMTKEELINAWDRGLVGMKVLVEGEKDAQGILHLVISEVVTEVNGKNNMAQRNAMQQLVDVYPDGQLVYKKPCAASAKTNELMGEHRHGHHGHHGHHGRKSCFVRKVSAWFNDLAFPAKIFFATLLGAFLGALASAFTRLMVFMIRGPAVAVIEIHDESEPFITKVSIEDAEKLPVYTSEGYTKVATDEKKESQ
ncbi:hypothetical protein DFJ77DRAFT_461592 [Powellomyces hirtus]|nr:hypothetical protein DFJ77DRAFT_461592 [Powellomyces hirtus]